MDEIATENRGEKGSLVLNLQNKQDREAVAMALFRAGYTVREVKRKENGKSIVLLEYWR